MLSGQSSYSKLSKPQRQQGLRMMRVRIPLGNLSVKQLRTLAAVSGQYGTGHLHFTARQSVQMYGFNEASIKDVHKLLRSESLEVKYAFNNSIRSITATPDSGIRSNEIFDVSPYALYVNDFFNKKSIKNLPGKVKIHFSSSEKDKQRVLLNDIGFLAKVKYNGEKRLTGFSVFIGGSTSGKGFIGNKCIDFLSEDYVLSFIEIILDTFKSHFKGRTENYRLKDLIEETGFDQVMELVHKKLQKRSAKKSILKKIKPWEEDLPNPTVSLTKGKIDRNKFDFWLETNSFVQKERGFFGVLIPVQNGNLSAYQATRLANIIDQYASKYIRLTTRQGILLRYVKRGVLPVLYEELNKIGLATPGYFSLSNNTSCPGKDSCALALSSTTPYAESLATLIKSNFKELQYREDMSLGISGCMNSCGQHKQSSFGLKATTVLKKNKVLPAMEIFVGGGCNSKNEFHFGHSIGKVEKDNVLSAMEKMVAYTNKHLYKTELFTDMVERIGIDKLKKQISDLTIEDEAFFSDDLIDENQTSHSESNRPDMYQTLLDEANQILQESKLLMYRKYFSDATYMSYRALLKVTKALLLKKDVQCHSLGKITKSFETYFIKTGEFSAEKWQMISSALQDTAQNSNPALLIESVLEFIRFAEKYPLEMDEG